MLVSCMVIFDSPESAGAGYQAYWNARANHQPFLGTLLPVNGTGAEARANRAWKSPMPHCPCIIFSVQPAAPLPFEAGEQIREILFLETPAFSVLETAQNPDGLETLRKQALSAAQLRVC